MIDTSCSHHGHFRESASIHECHHVEIRHGKGGGEGEGREGRGGGVGRRHKFDNQYKQRPSEITLCVYEIRDVKGISTDMDGLGYKQSRHEKTITGQSKLKQLTIRLSRVG